MADLGTIAYPGSPNTGAVTFAIPAAYKATVYGVCCTQFHPVAFPETSVFTEAITGVVKKSGTPTDGITVRAYHRDSGQRLAECVTAGGGVFSFSTLTNSAEIFCIALDVSENALVFDHLTAV